MKPLAAALLTALLVVLAAAAVGSVKRSDPPAKRVGRVVPRSAVLPRVYSPGSLDIIYVATDVPRSIPDGPGGVVTSTLTVPDALTLTDVNVQLSITHTWIRDLRISLISPDQVEVVLLDLFYGDSVVNMTNTWFNDEATVAIQDGQAPFSGSYRPQSPLTAFDGHPSAGLWTLRVEDRFAADTGSVVAWTLELNPPVNLAGTVRDSRTSLPLPGVHVEVLDSVAQAFTDSLGGYGIEGVPVDTFSVRFSLADYDTLLIPGVIISPGIVTTLDAALRSTYTSFVSTATDTIADTSFATTTLRIADNFRISDLDVTVNIRHTYPGDLSLILESPYGDSVTLVAVGETCLPYDLDDILDCRFDDQAVLPFLSGEPPFTGKWQPAEPLSAFYSDSTRDSTAGTWSLHVSDNCPDDAGRILGFTLHFRVVDTTVAVEAPSAPQPRAFRFDGAYPNPFNSRAVFAFELAQPGRVALVLYNTLGQEVARVADGLFAAGSHQVSFDAGSLSSGLYFARLSAADGATQSRKIVLLR